MANYKNSFGLCSQFTTASGNFSYFSLEKTADMFSADLERLPVSIKILLENLVRNEDGRLIEADDIENLANWDPKVSHPSELPFMPARVLLQDFTGVPAVVDLAAMRNAADLLYGNPLKINPTIPAELVIDHSVQVDFFGSDAAFKANIKKEFERNAERYAFLRWGQKNLDNFKVTPPGTGICHQVNLEYLARVVFQKAVQGVTYVFPDTLVGLDSHTTMINSVGVMGWGVGGIEAEAVLLGRPYYLLTPQVVGFELTGSLSQGTTATDLVLTITQILRERGVVGKFVEFFGTGLTSLSLEDRATISNMSPEYGATMGFFPVDDITFDYLRLTGRSEEELELVEHYCKTQHIFRTDTTPAPVFSETLKLDLNTVKPCVAGPNRPQDRVPLNAVKDLFPGGTGSSPASETNQSTGSLDDLDHGSVVIAAITSCTNTSNPSVLISAGLLAKKAVEAGLTVKPWVKTSLAPGSKVVMNYLEASGLYTYLAKLNFHHVAYGCTTCIGNSGSLTEEVTDIIIKNNLNAAAVLSGNRNFEGRINPLTPSSFLASPPLVVAYALAGTMTIDFDTDPIGRGSDGKNVFLKDLWPRNEEIAEIVDKYIKKEAFHKEYATLYEGSAEWRDLVVSNEGLYPWNPDSTYIKKPPFFENLSSEIPELVDIKDARVLVLLGDSVTTDHISPAGAIPEDSPAGQYLIDQDIPPSDFNSYGSRRGNHEVMLRGTFGNIRLSNQLVPGISGGWTLLMPENKKMTIYEAAMTYMARQTPLIVLAGKEYGTGSSRDWAAKGTQLLGIKAVLAESFERIHRSNLICMGILPLQFMPGDTWKTLGIDGKALFDITGIEKDLQPQKTISLTARKEDGRQVSFSAIARIDSPVELEYYRHGGILNYVLRHIE
jgi:aconitate hydratase